LMGMKVTQKREMTGKYIIRLRINFFRNL
jgi:hypothetical protein